MKWIEALKAKFAKRKLNKAETTTSGLRRVTISDKLECPGCHQPIIAGVTQGPHPQPDDGDLGCCQNCGAILEFRKKALHLLSQTQWEKLDPEDREGLTQMSAMLLRRQHRTPTHTSEDEIKELFE